MQRFKPTKITFKDKSAKDQADEILKKMKSEPGGASVGITYSANHAQTKALRNFYAEVDSKASSSIQKQAWEDVKKSFEGAGAQGAVMGAFLQNLPEGDRGRFRILPITTMAYSDSNKALPTKAKWLKEDMQDINDFAAKDNTTVLGWQNENTKAGKFAIGGNNAKECYTEEQSQYVQKHLTALSTALNSGQPLPGVENAPESPEQKNRDNKAAHHKKLEANKKEFEKYNRHHWEEILNLADKAKRPDKDAAGLLLDATTNIPLKTGYYKSTDPGDEKLRLFHYDEKTKTITMCGTGAALTYKDYGNARDCLRSQGVNRISFDYGDVMSKYDTLGYQYIVNHKAADTVKYLLDSIYEPGTWEKKVDKNGFELKGKTLSEADYRKPPVAIILGQNIRIYINKHMGGYDPATGKGSRASKLAFRLHQLEKLSLENVKKYEKEMEEKLKKDEPKKEDVKKEEVKKEDVKKEEVKVEEVKEEVKKDKEEEEVKVENADKKALLIETAKKQADAVAIMANNVDEVKTDIANLDADHDLVKVAFTSNEVKALKETSESSDKNESVPSEIRAEIKKILQEYVDKTLKNPENKAENLKIASDSLGKAEKKQSSVQASMAKIEFDLHQQETVPNSSHHLKK